MASKFNCDVSLTIDERCVGQKLTNGTYHLNLDFTHSQVNPCELDSVSFFKELEETYSRIKPKMSYMENHSNVMIGFSKTKIVNNIETTIRN